MGDSFKADFWISQRAFLAFDYVSHFDDLSCLQALSDADVSHAMPVVVEWSRMRRLPDGAIDDGQIIGLDLNSGVKVDLETDRGLVLLC